MKFQAMYEFRDKLVADLGAELLVYQNPECVRLGINPFDHGSAMHTDTWKTEGLKQALDLQGFDLAFGGARRDEEKSRAKERVFPIRSRSTAGTRSSSARSCGSSTTRARPRARACGCSRCRTGPNSTCGQYIHREQIPIVPLYFTAPRPVVERAGTLIMVDDDRMWFEPGEVPQMKSVRFRTLGCYPLSAASRATDDRTNCCCGALPSSGRTTRS